MNENLTVKDANSIPFVAVAPDEICRINADGTTTYHWDRIEAAAQRWEPGCADIAVCLSKLLLPLKQVQEQKQEPYCHIYEYDLPSGYKHRSFYPSLCKGRDANRAVAVYALPPRREWVSITDDEIEMAWMTTPEIHQLEGLLFARAIEAALKEKNQ